MRHESCVANERASSIARARSNGSDADGSGQSVYRAVYDDNSLVQQLKRLQSPTLPQPHACICYQLRPRHLRRTTRLVVSTFYARCLRIDSTCKESWVNPRADVEHVHPVLWKAILPFCLRGAKLQHLARIIPDFPLKFCRKSSATFTRLHDGTEEIIRRISSPAHTCRGCGTMQSSRISSNRYRSVLAASPTRRETPVTAMMFFEELHTRLWRRSGTS